MFWIDENQKKPKTFLICKNIDILQGCLYALTYAFANTEQLEVKWTFLQERKIPFKDRSIDNEYSEFSFVLQPNAAKINLIELQ